jgi:NitT/TauT family transport system ATP-binding protein
MAEVQLRNVRQYFRRSGGALVEAVSDVSLVIRAHEFVCIIGPSGCGKTTLLQLVAGLIPVSRGQMAVDGVTIAGPSPDRGLVFQRDSVEIARKYLEQVGLGHVERSWPRELSGGMLKRVAVATVFANSPRVLLMDEPFGALDYVTKLQLHQLLLNLWGQYRPTVLFVTHDVDEAMLLADRIIVMKEGRVVDDRQITLARPRTVESLALPEAVAHKEVLLRHLGLSELVRDGAAPR